MPDITMATQVMTMDSNNSADNVASKLADVSITSPDSNNNKSGIESGDASATPTKVSASKTTDLETVPESQTVNTHSVSHDNASETGKENLQNNSETCMATPTEDAAEHDNNREIVEITDQDQMNNNEV